VVLDGQEGLVSGCRLGAPCARTLLVSTWVLPSMLVCGSGRRQVPGIVSSSLTPDIVTGISFTVADLSSVTRSQGWCPVRLSGVRQSITVPL
jgi:hypothetical protein